MMTDKELDKYIKQQVESIDYDGADAAWEAFASGVGAEVLADEPKGRRRIAPWLWLSALLVIGSIAMGGSMLWNRNTQSPTYSPNQIINEGVYLDQHSDTAKSLYPKKNAPSTESQAKDILPKQRKSDAEPSLIGPMLPNQTQVIPAKPLAVAKSAPTSSTIMKHEQSQVSLQGLDEEHIPLLTSVPDMPLTDTPMLQYNESVNIETGPFLRFKNRSELYAITGVNTKGAMLAGVGVEIPVGKLGLETGFGVIYNPANDINANYTIANILTKTPEDHQYQYRRTLDFVLPLKVRVPMGKHTFMTGANMSLNILNESEVDSSVSALSSDAEVHQFRVTESYKNTDYSNSLLGKTYQNPIDLEWMAGYEYRLRRFSIGINANVSLIPSLKIKTRIETKTKFVDRPASVYMTLKYYI